ncbi:hypothetical protein ACQJBY_037841 [Aegilops geniculata]
MGRGTERSRSFRASLSRHGSGRVCGVHQMGKLWSVPGVGVWKGSMACAATTPSAGGVAMEADGGLEFLLDRVDRFPLREESADNMEHPDPVPLALLPRREIRRRKNASPTRSPQSTGKVNHEAPGWTKVEAGEYTALQKNLVRVW